MHDALETRWATSLEAQARYARLARQARAADQPYEVGVNTGSAIAEHGVRSLLIDVDVALIELVEGLQQQVDRVDLYLAEAARRGDTSWGGSSTDHWAGIREGLYRAIAAVAVIHIDHSFEELDDEVDA